MDKDTAIDFDSVDSEIARIDIDDSDAMPKAWKLQGFDNQNVKSGLMNSHQIEKYVCARI